MASDRSHSIRANFDRLFIFILSAFLLVVALFAVAIGADLLFHLGWGFKVSDLKSVGIMGLIGVGIFVWSRIVKHILDDLSL